MSSVPVFPRDRIAGPTKFMAVLYAVAVAAAVVAMVLFAHAMAPQVGTPATRKVPVPTASSHSAPQAPSSIWMTSTPAS